MSEPIRAEEAGANAPLRLAGHLAPAEKNIRDTASILGGEIVSVYA